MYVHFPRNMNVKRMRELIKRIQRAMGRNKMELVGDSEGAKRQY